MSHSLTSDDPLLDKLKHSDIFNKHTIGKITMNFSSQEAWGP